MRSARSPQLGAFLRFVVEAVLQGKSDRIKGYTIGVEVLRRDPSFDPQADPIVRVEATRLRRTIERYYAGPGADDAIIVDLPRGSYVPTFRRRDVGFRSGDSLRRGVAWGRFAQRGRDVVRADGGRFLPWIAGLGIPRGADVSCAIGGRAPGCRSIASRQRHAGLGGREARGERCACDAHRVAIDPAGKNSRRVFPLRHHQHRSSDPSAVSVGDYRLAGAIDYRPDSVAVSLRFRLIRHPGRQDRLVAIVR